MYWVLFSTVAWARSAALAVIVSLGPNTLPALTAAAKSDWKVDELGLSCTVDQPAKP